MYFVTPPPVGMAIIWNGRHAECVKVEGRVSRWLIDCSTCPARYHAGVDREFSRISHQCAKCEGAGVPVPAHIAEFAAASVTNTFRGHARMSDPDVSAAIAEKARDVVNVRHWSGAGTVPAEWFGYAIASMTKLDPVKDRTALNAFINGLLKSGALRLVYRRDATRRKRLYIEPGI